MRLIHAGLMTLAFAMAPATATEPPPGPLSPACALLTPEVAAAWTQAAADTSDDGPAQYGMSNCQWTSASYGHLIVTLMDTETTSKMGGAEKTFDQYLKSFAFGAKATPEPLDGIGDKAAIILEGEGDMQSATLMIMKGERVVSISVSPTTRDIALAVANAVAANF